MKLFLVCLLTLLLQHSFLFSDQPPDTHTSAIILDSENIYKTRGTIHLAIVHGMMLKAPARYSRYLISLKDAFHRMTKINVILDRPCRLESPRLLDMPFIYLTTYDMFELNDLERKNVKAFFDNGGFMFLDNARPTLGQSGQEISMKKMLTDALGPGTRFRQIPLRHPIFNLFFQLPEGPPPGFSTGPVHWSEYYVTGVWVDNRLVAILSNRGYTIFLHATIDNEPHLRFCINAVIYALIYGGKKTDDTE